MRVGSKRGARDAVVLSLERTGAMNDDLRRCLLESCAEIGRCEIEPEIASLAASCREHFDCRIAGERTTDADAEIPVTAEYNDAARRHAAATTYSAIVMVVMIRAT